MRARPRGSLGRLPALCFGLGRLPALCFGLGGLPPLCSSLAGLRAGVLGRVASGARPLRLRQGICPRPVPLRQGTGPRPVPLRQGTVALASVVEQDGVSEDRSAERSQCRVRAVDPELRRSSGTCAVVAHQTRRAVQRKPSHPQIAVDQRSRNSTQVQRIPLRIHDLGWTSPPRPGSCSPKRADRRSLREGPR
jgi:hypothetical protein